MAKKEVVEVEVEVPEVVLEQPPEGWVGIKESAEATGYQPQYVRQLVLKSEVEAVKLSRGGYMKWFVNPVSLDTWKNHRTRSGLRRYLLRTAAVNEDAIRKALDAVVDDDGKPIVYTLALAYVPKPKDAADAEAAEAMSEDAPAEDLEFSQ